MFDPTISLFSQRLATYSVLLTLGILFSLGSALRRTPNTQRAALMDVTILMVIGGLAGARALHVLAHWDYFQHVPDEILRLASGGLSWHGALLGALFAGLVAARYRQFNQHLLLNHAALALPILAVASWAACGAANCAYGREVATLAAYPSGMAWVGPDIYGIWQPRFHTQLLGLLASSMLLLLALWLQWRHVAGRLWLLLICWSGVMFVLGLLRGDAILHYAGLRLDQVFDLITLVFAGVVWWRTQISGIQQAQNNAPQ